MARSSEPRSTLIAYMLCFPLGVLGLHKFYLHQPVRGVLYFFTGGLFVVGWLYDLVTLPVQVAHYNEEYADDPGIQALMEEEILDLEEELLDLQEEIKHLRSDGEAARLRKRIEELESQLRTHNEPQ